MTAHEYAQNLASKGTPLNAISRATGLSMQDITYLRPRERRSYTTPKPETAAEVMPQYGSRRAKTVFMDSCERLNVDPAIILGDKRDRKYVWPRQEIMFDIFVTCPRMSHPSIARMMKRDHTTVIHGIRQHCKRIGITYAEAVAMRVTNSNGESSPRLASMYINSAVFEAAMGRYSASLRLAAEGRV